jgi:hypothetical protein
MSRRKFQTSGILPSRTHTAADKTKGEVFIMGNRQFKKTRSAVRKEKTKVVSQFMTNNWSQVVVSSVNIIRRFNFKNRFIIAMRILFKPDRANRKKKQKQEVAVTPPQENKPAESGAA